jgi:hypothetical protein
VRGAGTIRIKTPSSEAADELVSVLRSHGLAGELRRPYGSEVEVELPSRAVEEDAMAQTVRGVELWLLLDGSPGQAEVRCGKEVVVVSIPGAEVAAG